MPLTARHHDHKTDIFAYILVYINMNDKKADKFKEMVLKIKKAANNIGGISTFEASHNDAITT